MNKLPGHVYFSHKAHVVWAEMSCEDCHKGAKDKFEPYQKSDIAYLTMGKCMSCHEKKGASFDCITRH
ncbi:MAG: cytochrome c3 family protein [Candidatus Calescibacterium sp.]